MGHDSTFQPRSQLDAAGFVSNQRWLRNWQRAWSQVACGAGLAIGCFLLWRRLDGGLQRPLGWQSLLAVGLGLVIAAAAVRHFWTEDNGAFLSGRRWLPTMVLLIVGLAVSLTGTNGLALIAFWALLLTTECLWLFRQAPEREGSVADVLSDEIYADEVDEIDDGALDPIKQTDDERQKVDQNVNGVSEASDVQVSSTAAAPLVVGALGAQVANEMTEIEEAEIEEAEGGAGEGGEVLQRLLRNRDANGQEVLFGELRADFAMGERQTRLHVAFCPPLEQPPQVHAEATFVDESLGQVTVKVAQVLVLGTRIDVELEAPAKSAGYVQVEFYAAAES